MGGSLARFSQIEKGRRQRFQMEILVEALANDREFGLELTLVAGTAGLRRKIGAPRIQKPGLAIAGLPHTIGTDRVQVLGNTEMQYLHSLQGEPHMRAAAAVFEAPGACVVLTSGREVLPSLRDLADQHEVTLFGTPLSSGTFISRVHHFLDEHLSPEQTMHGVLLDVFGLGVLLTGHSGIGKSECALDLVLRGHRLVSDDVVVVRRHDQELVGIGSPLTLHHMEVRGIGIINVRDLFGAASVCERKRIELVVEMLEWRSDMEYERLGIDDHFHDILDTQVPKVSLPIRPGRNVAAIVEVAVRNHLLKLQGHHSALDFKESLEKQLAAAATHGPKPDDLPKRSKQEDGLQ